MKKVIVILVIGVAGMVAQSCGAGEKCPAYSENNLEQAEYRG
jgi:hypothetical protein